MLRVGTQSDTWYSNEDPEGSVAYYKSSGFDTIDFDLNKYIRCGELKDMEPPFSSFYDQSVEELCEFFAPFKAACKKHDVTVAQIHAPFSSWYSGKDAFNEYMIGVHEKCIAIAAFLDCPGIVIHPVHGAGDAEWEVNLWQYRSLIPAAKKYGVKILLENIFGRYNGRFIQSRLSSPDRACALYDLLESEAGEGVFGFCFDVGHAIITCQDVPGFVRALGHRLTNLHIHDNNGLDDLHLIPYSCLTTGPNLVCDWDGLVEALKEINYRGALCFETFKSVRIMPAAVRKELLTLIAAIGHHWSDIITGE